MEWHKNAGRDVAIQLALIYSEENSVSDAEQEP